MSSRSGQAASCCQPAFAAGLVAIEILGDRFLSSAGAGGNCARPMRLPDPSPVLDKNRAPMGPGILSSTGAGVWRKAPMAFPDSSSVLDKFPSARFGSLFTSLVSDHLM